MNKETKFKIGDKVRVKSQEWYDAQPKGTNGTIFGTEKVNFSSFMTCYLGNVLEIHNIIDGVYTTLGNSYSWEEWMLEDDVVKEECSKETPAQDSTFESILKDMLSTYKAKNKDYGNSFSKTLDEFGLVASAVQLSHKMERAKTLVKSQAMVKDESIEDTILDLAVYAVITLAWMREEELKQVFSI